MNYPQGFFQRMFATGRGLELSRRFAIYICAILFLIAVVGGTIFWAHRSSAIRPYFIYVSGNEWIVHSANKNEEVSAAPWYRLLQESIVASFAADYMRISSDVAENNNMLWCRCSGRCDIDPTECRICCASDTRMFSSFSSTILPIWQEMFDGGQFMTLSNISATPVSNVTERGGIWRVTGTLMSNIRTPVPVVIYITIARNPNTHVRTFGFHVADFNFYTGVK